MLRGIYKHSGGAVGDLPITGRLLDAGEESAGLDLRSALAVVCASPGAGQATMGDVSCVLEGTLYDRRELAAKLGVEDGSDACLMLHAYRRWGETLLTKVRGRFALVLWDAAGQRGFIGCDRLSTQPLFLWRGTGYLAFASELHHLLALLPSGPGPDPVSFVNWLGGWTVAADSTLYEGVSRLPPGELVELVGDARPRTFWRAEYEGTLNGTRAELADGLRNQIEAAVARRLSPNSSGVVLSGGLDSSIVTSLGSRAKLPDASIHTYSAVFPGAEYDEAWKVKSLSRALDIEPSMFEIAPQGGLSFGLNYLKQWKVPLTSNSLLIDAVLVAAAAEDGTEVVLEGHTGDELFGATPWAVADMLTHGRILGALGLARNWPARPTTWRQRRSILWRWGLKGAAPHGLHRYARARKDPDDLAPAWLRADLRARYAQQADPWAWKSSARGPRWWRFQASLLFQAPHREHRLDYLRRRAASAGVVAETPLYDADLIDYCLRLPPKLAFDSAFTRPLAREAMRGLIPDDVRLDNNKAVFSPFCFDMVTGADAPGLDRILSAPDAELGAYVDMAQIRSQWAARPRRGPGFATMLWGSEMWRLAAAESWLRSLNDTEFVDELLASPEVPPPAIRRSGEASDSTFLEPTFSGLETPSQLS